MQLPHAVVVTPEEYDALPSDSRIELVDGVLHVMTPPNTRHQIAVDHLLFRLKDVCPKDLVVLREQEIRLDDDHRRNPDIMVVQRSSIRLDHFSYHPADVVLAIEVVSPGTQTADRKHKPVEYAEAGIRYYWRVEPTPPLSVYTFRLHDGDRYEPTGVFSVGDVISVPGLDWAAIRVTDVTI